MKVLSSIKRWLTRGHRKAKIKKLKEIYIVNPSQSVTFYIYHKESRKEGYSKIRYFFKIVAILGERFYEYEILEDDSGSFYFLPDFYDIGAEMRKALERFKLQLRYNRTKRVEYEVLLTNRNEEMRNWARKRIDY